MNILMISEIYVKRLHIIGTEETLAAIFILLLRNVSKRDKWKDMTGK